MKHRYAKHILFAAALTASVLLSGCGKQSVSQTDTVLVLGMHANEAAPAVTDITPYLNDTCLNGGTLTLISCEGSPRVIETQSFEAVSVLGDKQSVAEERAQDFVRQNASACMAKSNGIDILKSIYNASSVLETENGHAKKLVIYDTFLNDSKPLDLTSVDISRIDVNETVAELSLPDLSGVDVTCIAAKTAKPQDEISDAQKQILKELYTTIFQECGASSVTFKDAVNSSDTPIESKYTVKPIAVSDDEPSSIHIVLDCDKVAFKEDSAEFLDEIAAKKAIEQAAKQLISSNETVYICGSTASSSDETKAVELSRKRAQVVADELLGFGLNKSHISGVIGFGYRDSPYTQNDLDENGNQIESVAKKNRTVVIESTASDIGKSIAAGF